MGLQVMLICKGPVKKRRAASETYKHLHFIVGSQFALQFNFEDVSRGAQLWFTQYNGRYFVRPSDLFKNNHDQFHSWLNFASIMCYVWCIHVLFWKQSPTAPILFWRPLKRYEIWIKWGLHAMIAHEISILRLKKSALLYVESDSS